jgi:hypothetical protein
VVVALELALRGERKLGVTLVLTFGAGFIGGSVALGQTVSGLGRFLTGGWAVSAGYNGAMSLEPTAAALAGGVVTYLAALGAMGARYRELCLGGGKPRWGLRLLVVWLFLLLFAAWKHGFVRADPHHAKFFLGFAPILGLLLQALPGSSSGQSRLSLAFACACCACSLLTLQSLLSPALLEINKPLVRAAANAATLVRPADYCRQMERLVKGEQFRAGLPHLRAMVGSAPMDVFGNYQAYAVFNDLNYRPRPMFQSYSAYTPELMRRNEQFYRSAAAPEFVLAKLGTIDERLPALEDAMLFRYLLRNHEPVGSEGGFLLLKPVSSVAPKLDLLREGKVRPAEPIDLSGYGNSNLWLEIDVRPTPAGRLRQLVYQPSIVRLRVWSGSASQLFRAPPPMMAAGFVASPLVLSSEDLANVYAGKPVVRPRAYSVELAGSTPSLWQEAIPYRLYRLADVATAPARSQRTAQASRPSPDKTAPAHSLSSL